MEWDATDRLSFRLNGDYIDDDSDPRQGHRLTVGNLEGAPVLDDVYDSRAGLAIPKQNVESLGGALTTNLAINDLFTLRNIVAYRSDTSYTPIDFDSLPGGGFDPRGQTSATPDLDGDLDDAETYSLPLALFAKDGNLSVITSASYRDKTSQFETPNPFLDQDAYTLWDLSIVWEDNDGHGRLPFLV